MTEAEKREARRNWMLEAETGDELPAEILGVTTEADGFPLPSGSSMRDLDRIERWFSTRQEPAS